MKRIFFIFLMLIGVLGAIAQEAEKSFADLKNEGNAAIRSKDYPTALDLYEKAMVKWGDQPIADSAMIINMGYCALKAKNYEKSLKYFDQAISMNYKKSTAYMFKADVYTAMKDMENNLKSMESAYEVDPNNASIKTRLGNYYAREASAVYSNGGKIITKANADVTAGKIKVSDEAYKTAVQEAKAEFEKSMPLIEKALSYDEKNAPAKQLKAACEQALK